MKKYVIGIAVGAVFLVYSLVLRNQHSGPVIAPPSIHQHDSSSSSQASTNTSSTPSSSSNTNTSTQSNSASQYKDGTYTGSVANAFYGNIQVSATITNGKISTVDFLQYPNDSPNSSYINQIADPYLKQEAIQAQSANVSIVTGATLSSQAFIQSLGNALSQAKT